MSKKRTGAQKPVAADEVKEPVEATQNEDQEPKTQAPEPEQPVAEPSKDDSQNAPSDEPEPKAAEAAEDLTGKYRDLAPKGLEGIGSQLGQYIEAMQPNQPQDAGSLQRHQQRLRGIVNAILALPDEKFAAGLKFLIETIREHRSTVFNERYVFRGFDMMRTARSERQKLEQLIGLFLATADSKSPKNIGSVVDLNVVFKYVTDNDQQQKLQSYYGVE